MDDATPSYWPLALFAFCGIWYWIAALRRKNKDLEMKVLAAAKLEEFLRMSDTRRDEFIRELEDDLDAYSKLHRDRTKALEHRYRMRNRKLRQWVKDRCLFSVFGQQWNHFIIDDRGSVTLLSEHWLMETLREKHLVNDAIKRHHINESVRGFHQRVTKEA